MQRIAIVLILALIGLCGGGAWLSLEFLRQQEAAQEIEVRLARAPERLDRVLKEPRENWTYRRVYVSAYPSDVTYYVADHSVDADRNAKEFVGITLPGRQILMSDMGYIPWPVRTRPHETAGPSQLRTAQIGDAPEATRYRGILLPAQASGLFDSVPSRPEERFDVPDIGAMDELASAELLSGVYLFVEAPKTRGHEIVPFSIDSVTPSPMKAIFCFGVAILLALGFLLLAQRPVEYDDEEPLASEPKRTSVPEPTS